MNIGALLQDSPSEDRKRASDSPQWHRARPPQQQQSWSPPNPAVMPPLRPNSGSPTDKTPLLGPGTAPRPPPPPPLPQQQQQQQLVHRPHHHHHVHPHSHHVHHHHPHHHHHLHSDGLLQPASSIHAPPGPPPQTQYQRRFHTSFVNNTVSPKEEKIPSRVASPVSRNKYHHRGHSQYGQPQPQQLPPPPSHHPHHHHPVYPQDPMMLDDPRHHMSHPPVYPPYQDYPPSYPRERDYQDYRDNRERDYVHDHNNNRHEPPLPPPSSSWYPDPRLVDRDREREQRERIEREREQEHRDRERDEAQRIQQQGIALQLEQHERAGSAHGHLSAHRRDPPQQPQIQQQVVMIAPPPPPPLLPPVIPKAQPGAAQQSLQTHDSSDYLQLDVEDETVTTTASLGIGLPTPQESPLYEEEKGRSRVKVDLGTWIYPKVPFPYFFELGSGLVGMKDREDQREQRELERIERERIWKEREEREKQEREQKEREERERKEREEREKEKMEEGEIPEKETAPLPSSSSAPTSAATVVPTTSLPQISRPPSPIRLPEPPTQPLIDIETRTTIIIPHGFIPTEKPLKPHLWGGGAFAPGRRPPPRINSASQLRHRSSTSRSINLLTGIHVEAGSRWSRKTRRVYTDDSDIFLCAIHAGWVTWSGAWKAKERGRDIKVDLRVIRVAGAGKGNIFAQGIHGSSKDMALHEGGDPNLIKEEMIGRFTGGFGEKCFNPLGVSGRMMGEEVDVYESEVLSAGVDDPENDGRSLVSGGWGVGHDGSAIEIVNVQFVERNTAHGMGRRNRSQRLLEYAERRAAVLGQTPSIRQTGRKRRRNWDNWPVQPRRAPNASVLDVIHEVDEEDLEEELRRPLKKTRLEDEQRLMHARTMVFGMGASADLLVGYKYVPDMLRDLLFPSASSSPRQKRRRVEDEDVEMAEVVEDTPLSQERIRPVILETAKERYLLSPSGEKGSQTRSYDIALVLEPELEVEDDTPVVEEKVVASEKTPTATTPKELVPTPVDDKPTTPVASPKPSQPTVSIPAPPAVPIDTLQPTTSPVHSPEPEDPPPTTSAHQDQLGSQDQDRDKTPTQSTTPFKDSDPPKPPFSVQLLQQNLGKGMFRFASEGVYVRDDGEMGTEWVIQVKNWKWAISGKGGVAK